MKKEKLICLSMLIIFIFSCNTGSKNVKSSTDKDPVKSAWTENQVLTEAPSKWLGEDSHFVMIGKIRGYDFNIQVTGDGSKEKFSDIISAKREYEQLVTTKEIRLIQYEINLSAELNGYEREFEVEFSHSNFDTVKPAASMTVVEGENENYLPQGITGDQVGAKVEWEWEATDRNIFAQDEEVIKKGDFYFAMESSEINAEGVRENGKIAGYLKTAYDNGDYIVISFTVPVNNEIDFEEVGAFYE